MTRLRLLSQPVVLVLLAGTPVVGQTTAGLRAGASMSELAITGLHVDDQQPRVGYSLGASLGVPLSPRFGFALGAAYIQRGSTATLLQLGDVDHRIQYLRFSTLIRATVPLMGPLSLHVLGGPAIALETSCERETTLALQPVVFLIDCNDPESDTKTMGLDFGLAGGAGFGFALKGGITLSLELLYDHGIRTILESEQEAMASNRSAEVQVGLDFPIG